MIYFSKKMFVKNKKKQYLFKLQISEKYFIPIVNLK